MNDPRRTAPRTLEEMEHLAGEEGLLFAYAAILEGLEAMVLVMRAQSAASN